MKPVVSAPARKRGCCISAERKSTLWPMPSIWKASSASIWRSIASSRVGAAGDQLGDHRIVEHRDLAALGDAVVDAHALRLARRPVADEAAGRGQEAAIGILGIDAGLDRPAVELHVVLAEGELLAGGDADHLLDEVEAGHLLGHRMLDLEPGVHLEEVEAAGRRRR